MTYLDKIIYEEGKRNWAYLDKLKIWTIGVGFNLERAGANGALRAQGIDPDMIWAAIEETKRAGGGRKPGEHTGPLISDAQVKALLEVDINECLVDLRSLFPNFEDMPEKARIVLCDARFQLGPTRLRDFKNTLKALKASKWTEAAKGLRSSLAYQQTPKRWERNALLLETI